MRWCLVLAVSMLLAAGCGAVEHEPDLAAAVDGTQASESWLFELRGTEGVGGDVVQISCTGAADNARKRLDIACAHDRGGFAVRELDGVVYAKEGLGRDAKWRTTSADDEDSLDDLSPHKLLSILRQASVGSVHVGDDVVRGTPAARYRLTVDCVQAELRDCSGETAPVEVWIADDDTVRRIGVAAGDYSATMEFFGFGVEVDIKPPPSDQVEAADDPDEPRPCPADGGTPIRASRAIDALRRGGFSVTSRDACFAGLAAVFDNTGAPGVLEREGLVMCHLYEKRSSAATETIVRREVDGGDAELVLANLECLLFTDRPDPEPGIERLARAFRELER